MFALTLVKCCFRFVDAINHGKRNPLDDPELNLLRTQKHLQWFAREIEFFRNSQYDRHAEITTLLQGCRAAYRDEEGALDRLQHLASSVMSFHNEKRLLAGDRSKKHPRTASDRKVEEAYVEAKREAMLEAIDQVKETPKAAAE